ncbi:alkaline phosphatase family protein [Aspergillus tanneri]|uniref:PhoD-like phosphatase metallophosphatase domain-containing protein n=1 Tax=Aspergillus tanneri TaxID=1220188 RepID=A0A5M9MRL6_9EURO|nr:uncharacterized protein ATNIH1004_006287 [Aspergillus tanneri]KAA8647593.1 hypothetical protein ATNIH1004_006287 [Aspergillus tanneri]
MLQLVTAASSAIVRIGTFIFLRWIPGHPFPPLIFTALAVYITSLLSKQPPRRSRSALYTLFTGIPSSPAATRLTVLINLVLGLFTLDFLLHGLILYPSTDLAFSRIGYVEPTSAHLLIREPDATQLPLVISYREEQKGDWRQASVIGALNESTDFTAAVTLHDLMPATAYRYALSNNRSGSFVTAPPSGSSSLAFVTSSCMKANFPYSPRSHPLRIPGLETMTTTLAQLPAAARPAFMLFLGDFIYIDVPQRFGSSVSHYRSEYRRVYASPSWATLGADNQPALDLPWIHTLDDHEIANDWSRGNLTAPYPAAADPYRHYHVSVNPPRAQDAFAASENVTYFSFVRGPASFFLLDTRTYRSTPGKSNSSILGAAQRQSLLAYLARPEPHGVHWKFVASSVPFTKNWHVGTSDTWGGFLNERQIIFDAMWRAERDLGVRVVLLSGDRHEFGATRFPDPASRGVDSLDQKAEDVGREGNGLHEFSVGPLSMFYLPIRTYRQTDEEDVAIKYLADGNVKYGVIDIDRHDDASVLTYSLYINDALVWQYCLTVPLSGSTLPPGQVLLDSSSSTWSSLQTMLGRMEEMAGRLRRRFMRTYSAWNSRP